jgi:3-dehydroquinate dehydratase-2
MAWSQAAGVRIAARVTFNRGGASLNARPLPLDFKSDRRTSLHPIGGLPARMRLHAECAARTAIGNEERRMTARLMVLNGPNLNLLGTREPHIYGSTTLDAVKASCEEFAKFAGARLSFHQSNHEGVLVDLIQAARQEADAIIINPAAYSFTSIAMLDAFKIFEGPIFEVHVSNIHARDALHSNSILSSAVKAVIAGLGPYGYIVAMQAALHALGKLPPSFPASLREVPR